ncbi:hypothetical protein GV729_09320 [Pseudomonas sp. Fl4BN2]|nr:hypothetical protein [Pseudomonas sp. Fl4BN2]
MRLLEFSYQFYKSGNYALPNGVPCTEEHVRAMLDAIRQKIISDIKRPDGRPAPIAAIENLEVTGNGLFTLENPADLLALIFQEVVEDNGNPSIWNDSSLNGWKAPVGTALSIIFYGANAAFSHNRAEGVQADKFSVAKAQLKDFIYQSRNLFSG